MVLNPGPQHCLKVKGTLNLKQIRIKVKKFDRSLDPRSITLKKTSLYLWGHDVPEQSLAMWLSLPSL